jgi:hypothetical protein
VLLQGCCRGLAAAGPGSAWSLAPLPLLPYPHPPSPPLTSPLTPPRTPTPPHSYGDIAPGSVENFAALALGNTPGGVSYKGSKFHRVIENFMLQGGDVVNGDGTGSFTVWDGKGGKFADENLDALPHEKGVLSMANSGPNSNGAARKGGEAWGSDAVQRRWLLVLLLLAGPI